MHQSQKYTMKRFSRSLRPGFTLIELLVVIAIIGILASIVLASLNTARKKSRDARRVADIKQIQLALELYFDASVGGSANYAATLAPLAPTYIPTVPRDPLGGTSADYNYVSCTTTYHLAAALEESTNPALNSDRDAAINTICATDAINGSDAAQGTTCSGIGSRYCYDVTP
jgi:prepilin-type N-terminal cleavage/methylation domain-containing protein